MTDATPSAGDEHRVVEVEDDLGQVLAVLALVGEVGARGVLGGDRAQAQGADVGAAGQLDPLEDLRPGIDRVAGEGRVGVGAGVDRRDELAIGCLLYTSDAADE